ncbi:hypothetical protein E1202_20470 [Saccharopolyspora karakumensis]|jgi:hypothetical protein|uniref:PE family protein n=1 Tax=Saccharopolyspora karakumensis TaxID=2530386 RepID=A0A4R5BJZ8_9PSEU|nr:hypothetical protein [Saccharopolyspora karakumensis]TDD85663.1 hypothetical protein E1202_20470 [Saccharopolyspora karakumensis]
MTFPNIWSGLVETVDRMADKAALAQSQSAGGSMRIEPDKVDELASFFEAEALAMEAREADVFELATVPTAGKDPVSVSAASTYGQVAEGDEQAYLTNYRKLARVFKDTAANLRASATQTRTNDQDSADSLRS